ncbi:phosphatase PAP2 family protein [Actinospongicola halichondriae]|uniref:phosphatase PAP2 family protein n=1 Tax=Actinospongicola halichondriae TaxID=3236844 RepID=UPI003D55334E
MTVGGRDRRWRLAAGGLFVLLASGSIASRRTLWGEVALTEAVNTLPRLVIDALAVVMQIGTRPAILLVAVTMVVVAPGDWRRAAVAVIVAGTLSWFLADLAKEVVGRARPIGYSSEISLHDQASGPGFPSAHTAIAAGTFTAAALMARRRPTAAVVLAAVVGVARMAVGVHLPLDVIGGLGLGVAVAAVVTALVDR